MQLVQLDRGKPADNATTPQAVRGNALNTLEHGSTLVDFFNSLAVSVHQGDVVAVESAAWMYYVMYAPTGIREPGCGVTVSSIKYGGHAS